MEIGKRVVDHKKQLHGMTIPSRRSRSPTSSCKKVRANLLKKGTDVSVSTISRRLSKEFGLKSGNPAKKTKLTPLMKRKRLEFTRDHLKLLMTGVKSCLAINPLSSSLLFAISMFEDQ